MFVITGALLVAAVAMLAVYIARPARLWRWTLPPFEVLRVLLPLSLMTFTLSLLFALMGVLRLPNSILVQAETLRASPNYIYNQTATLYQLTITQWTPTPTFDFSGTEQARILQLTQDMADFRAWQTENPDRTPRATLIPYNFTPSPVPQILVPQPPNSP